MHGESLLQRRPIPTLATVAFVLSAVATAAYFAGLVPGLPRTLPTFARLLGVTLVTLAVATVAWVASLLQE